MSYTFGKEQKQRETLFFCIKEAERFISKAKQAMGRLDEIIDGSEGEYGPAGTKEFAAAKRAALDLKSQLTSITNKTFY